MIFIRTTIWTASLNFWRRHKDNPMARKRDRKRIFSLIYVPDQDRDPKSYSMSYTKGRLLVLVGILLVVHSVIGLFAYYEVFRFNHSIQSLKDENKDLKIRNKRIDEIAKKFQRILLTEEKIRRAFGGPLGLNDVLDGGSGVQNTPQPVRAVPAAEPSTFDRLKKNNEGFYFLSKNENAPSVPENLPTYLPVDGFMTTHFRKGSWYIGKSHYGIDIAAQRGSTVFAAGSGVVLLADWTPDFGNMIILSHGRGLISYYGHAEKLLVSQGAVVRKGQSIALLGSSGISSAPHLHFEIWRNGKPLDPEEFLFSVQERKSEPGS